MTHRPNALYGTSMICMPRRDGAIPYDLTGVERNPQFGAPLLCRLKSQKNIGNYKKQQRFPWTSWTEQCLCKLFMSSPRQNNNQMARIRSSVTLETDRILAICVRQDLAYLRKLVFSPPCVRKSSYVRKVWYSYVLRTQNPFSWHFAYAK